MNKEIELKFFVKSFEGILPRLKKLGGRLKWKGIEKNWFYDTPKEDLRKKGDNLRLRKWRGHSETMTFKNKTVHKKNFRRSNEFQLETNVDMMRKIFKGLGFNEFLYYQKYREHWVLPGRVSIELDKLKGKNIVEIEASPKKIKELALKLGLNWKTSTTKGYLGLLREWK